MNRTFALAGIVGGAIWVGLRFFSPDWGPPGSANYLGYELWSRAWAPTLTLMAVGFIGLRRSLAGAGRGGSRIGLAMLVTGLLVMAIGNAAEFWVFTDVPYRDAAGPNARDLSWMSFLLGALLGGLGATIAGLAMRLERAVPTWVWLPLALVLPATVAIGAVDMSWLGMPIGVAGIAAGTHGLPSAHRSPLRPVQA